MSPLHLSFWFSPGLCFVRLAGDLCLVASAPWLLFRLHKHGAEGISVETQILRLIMFLTRYLDLFVDGTIISCYNTTMKIIATVSALTLVGTLLFTHKAYSLISVYHLCLPLLFAGCLASVLTYRHTVVEMAWAFSQYLGIVANIPQLMLLVYPDNRDWKLNVYVALLAGFRAFYIPHWVLRYLDWGVFDPISVSAGVCELVIFLSAFAVILWNSRRRSQSQDPEAGPSEKPEKTSPIGELIETSPRVDSKIHV